MQKLTYIENNKYVQASVSFDNDKLSIVTGWGVNDEAMFRLGRLTLEQHALNSRLQLAWGYETTKSQVIDLGVDLLKAAQALLLENVPAQALDAKIAKLTEQFANTPAPVQKNATKKKSKAEQLKDKISEKVINSSLDEKLKLLQSFHVFQVSYGNYGSRSLHIKTYQTLAITHYKKLTKLAGVNYLKFIDFSVEVEPESREFAQIIFDLIMISIHTNKVGQDKLKQAKAERLTNKSRTVSTRPSYSADTRSNFQRWYDDADMPEKVNGVWVDLETGLPFQG